MQTNFSCPLGILSDFKSFSEVRDQKFPNNKEIDLILTVPSDTKKRLDRVLFAIIAYKAYSWYHYN